MKGRSDFRISYRHYFLPLAQGARALSKVPIEELGVHAIETVGRDDVPCVNQPIQLHRRLLRGFVFILWVFRIWTSGGMDGKYGGKKKVCVAGGGKADDSEESERRRKVRV